MQDAAHAITPNGDNVGVLIDAWKLLVGRLPTSAIEHADGVATTFGNVPLSFLNLSILDRPVADAAHLKAALGIAIERARACRHASLVAFCSGWAPADWADVVAQAGLKLSLNMTGMAADRLLPARRAAPALELRLVTDVATATDLAEVNAHAYAMAIEQVECISNLHIWKQNSFGVVGYVDGRPVTSASTFVLGDRIYVAFVATVPDSHGRGYAEAAFRKAVEHAQNAVGNRRLWLHASDMGRPLYRSMGFESGAAVPLFEFSEASSAS